MRQKIRYIDLFCGIGGFHYSFRKLDWECVMACDISAVVRDTYEKNYGMKPLGDIKCIEPSDVASYDILCAGFPCQAFSSIGSRKGFEDDRALLFFDILKFVNYHFPKVIILENVTGLLYDGHTFNCIQESIVSLGYIFKHKIVCCSDYGIPQKRKRVIMIALKQNDHLSTKIDDILNFDKFQTHVTLSEFLGKPFEKEFSKTVRCGGRHSKLDGNHNWDGYIVNGSVYRLTIDDCLKLQGFDDKFVLSGKHVERWKQVGNAIPTIITKMIGENLCECFCETIIKKN